MHRKTQKTQERFELADQVIMIEKLIQEKESQIKLLKNWLERVRGEENGKKAQKMDAKS